MYKLAVLILLVFLAGCASNGIQPSSTEATFDREVTNEMRKKMIGEWCGDKWYDDGSYRKWWVNRLEDGTYKIDFTNINAEGTVKNTSEYGLWGVRAPIYFSAMRGFIEDNRPIPADTTRADLYDAYKILELTHEEFKYKSYTSGNEFVLRRSCSGDNT